MDIILFVFADGEISDKDFSTFQRKYFTNWRVPYIPISLLFVALNSDWSTSVLIQDY